MSLQQGFGVLVVDVHHTHITALEQLTLPAAVFLKGLVLTGADVVRRKVGEHAHIVVHTGHAVHHQALAGHLHQGRVAAGIQELPEGLLQLVAFRGDVGGGGLALGAGHADHGHLAGGVAKEVGAHQSHGIAAAFHLHHGHARHGGQVDVVLNDQCADALGGTVCGKLVAVALGAHDAHEQQARGRLAAVINDVVDLGLRAALHQRVRHTLHQLFQFHTVYAPPKH